MRVILKQIYKSKFWHGGIKRQLNTNIRIIYKQKVVLRIREQ